MLIMKKSGRKKSVLVTGGAGFIGSHVADDLIKLGYKVVVLDDLSGGFLENVNKKAIFIKGSVNDSLLVKDIFSKYSFEYVFHLAAYAAEGLSHFIKRFNYENNLLGTVNLINASVNSGVKCFVFTSSIAVYGKHQTPMTEDLLPLPEDPYGIAKYAAELDLESSHKMFGLNYIIFRPHNVYGERQNIGDKYRNVLGIFMNNLMQGKDLPIFGDGEQVRAFTYIDDVAPLIAGSIRKPGAYNQVFNIGADKHHTVNQLALKIGKAMGVKPALKYLPIRNEVKVAFADHKKIRRIFKNKNSVDLDEGIRRMVKWVKKSGIKKSKEFKNVEIYKNMPPSWR